MEAIEVRKSNANKGERKKRREAKMQSGKGMVSKGKETKRTGDVKGKRDGE